MQEKIERMIVHKKKAFRVIAILLKDSEFSVNVCRWLPRPKITNTNLTNLFGIIN